jgi:hypothetical protein
MSSSTLELREAAAGVTERELAYRRNGALDIFLVWEPVVDTVKIRVEDLRTGVRVELDVEPDTALQAFRHPFSFAP